MYFVYSVYKVGTTINSPCTYFAKFAASQQMREDYTSCRGESIEELVKQLHECINRLKLSRQYAQVIFTFPPNLQRSYTHRDGGSIIYVKELSLDEEMVFLQLLTTPFSASNSSE